MVPRRTHTSLLRGLMEQFPVVGLIGARQVGKTTLARAIAAAEPGPTRLFDLEDPTDAAALHDPKLALEGRRGLVVIDEVKHRPNLFAVLRVLVDRPATRARFLVLGSAGPALLRQGSETLAGRIAFYELPPFRGEETGPGSRERLWLRGGFPRSFLAATEARSFTWRTAFVRSFLERDLPQLGFRMPAESMRRFWLMLAHWQGNRWSGAPPARSLGVSAPTVARWLDALVDALVVRRLPPWHENLKKRQVRAPKVYLADTGLLHALLGLQDGEELLGHPAGGASWEGFAIGEVTHSLRLDPGRCYYWATHQEAGLDLLAFVGSRRIGFGFKRTSAPRMTRSMRVALADLRLDRLFVVHPGAAAFPLHNRVEAIGLDELCARGPGPWGAPTSRSA